MKKLISVIIVNRDKKFFLVNCLESLKNQLYAELEIIVVDNASNPEILELVKTEYTQVKLIENKKNELYCKAVNQGIRVSQGEYVLCLNNDVVLSPSFISEAVKCFSLDEKIGMVSGKILKEDERYIDSAGLLLGRSRKPVDRGYRKKDMGIFWESGYVFGAGGAAVFFKRKMLEEIKINEEYFDEDFKIYYEDLDIAWRANLFNWKGYYTSLAIGRHYRGGTSKYGRTMFWKKYDFPHLNWECKRHLIKNRYLTILKNDVLKSFLGNLLFILFYEIKLWGYLLLFETKTVAFFIKNMPRAKYYLARAWKKRKIIKKKQG